MEKHTEKQFLHLLEKKDDINFIAAAITPWHALGISATICQLENEGITLKGYVMIISHPNTGKAIDESNFYLGNNQIEIIEIYDKIEKKNLIDKCKDKFQKYLYYMSKGQKKEKNLYWAAPYKPSYELIPKVAKRKTEYQIQVIVTDEGLADYLMTPYRTWQHVMKLKKGVKRKIESTWSLFIRDPYFESCLQKKNCLRYSQLLKKENDKWVKNEEIILIYKEILKKQKSEKDFSRYSNSILINTDTMYESGILLRNVDVPIFEKICDYGEKKKIPVLLKPHPRELHTERYQELKCEVETEKGEAQETILASLDKMPLCLIGTGSTTLVTAHLLFDVEIISVNKLINRKDLVEKTYFDNFNKTFSDFMKLPTTMEELEKNLNRLEEKYERN